MRRRARGAWRLRRAGAVREAAPVPGGRGGHERVHRRGRMGVLGVPQGQRGAVGRGRMGGWPARPACARAGQHGTTTGFGRRNGRLRHGVSIDACLDSRAPTPRPPRPHLLRNLHRNAHHDLTTTTPPPPRMETCQLRAMAGKRASSAKQNPHWWHQRRLSVKKK